MQTTDSPGPQETPERGKRRADGGFTLVELLVVITILGILAAIVVFSVGGVRNKGQIEACKSDTVTLQTAEEAYFSANNTYGTGAQLQSGGFTSNTSTLHTLTGTGGAGNPSATVYEVHEATNATCGTAGAKVDWTSSIW